MIHWFWEILVPLMILLWQKHWDLMDQTPKKQNNAIFLVIILVACGCQNCMIEYVLLFSLVISFLNLCGSTTPLDAKLLKYDTKVEELESKLLHFIIYYFIRFKFYITICECACVCVFLCVYNYKNYTVLRGTAIL